MRQCELVGLWWRLGNAYYSVCLLVCHVWNAPGGGLYVKDGSVVGTDEATAFDVHAAVATAMATRDLAITSNTASEQGGGVSIRASTTSVLATVSGVAVSSCLSALGGGVFVSSITPSERTATLSSSVVTGGVASLNGGGLYVQDVSMKLLSTLVTDNSAGASSGAGGMIARFATCGGLVAHMQCTVVVVVGSRLRLRCEQ